MKRRVFLTMKSLEEARRLLFERFKEPRPGED